MVNKVQSSEVAVLGGGSWGTVLAWLLAKKHLHVRLWMRDEQLVEALKSTRVNQKYLPNVSLEGIEFTSELEAAVSGVRQIVVAVPGEAVPMLAARWKELPVGEESILVSGTKGLHPTSGLRASSIWQKNGWPIDRYVTLSGPNLSAEIAAGAPTSTVAASENIAAATEVQQLFGSPLFRTYRSSDLIGVELGGALKNIIAIAAGIGDGLGYGDNAKASIITRGWREMTRLAIRLGAQESTLYGLSGMGDLFATCTSAHSRNYKLGFQVGQGASLDKARERVVQTAEGVHTTRAALHLARESGIELPVTEEIFQVLFKEKNPREAVTDLMKRQKRDENA